MAAGYAIDKASLDNRIGQLIQSVNQSLALCVRFKVLLDDTTILPDSVLVTQLGYSQAEANQIRAAFSAMQSLNNIAHGTQTQGALNDFFFDAKHLTGIQLT